jgi:hypothetical protein
MAAACAMAAGCGDSGESVSACLWRQVNMPANVFSFRRLLYEPGFWMKDSSAACILSATTCENYVACVYGPEPTYCRESASPVDHCNGTWAIHCVSNSNPGNPGLDLLAHDCADMPGLTCVLDVGGRPSCGVSTCDSTGVGFCDGSRVVHCSEGVLWHTDCLLEMGEPCSLDSLGTPRCSRDTGCTSDRCEGGDAVRCDTGYEWRRVPCAGLRIPAVCRVENDKSGCVPAPDLRCDPRTHVDRCDGTSLIYCDGDERALDCRTLGFSDCADGHCA